MKRPHKCSVLPAAGLMAMTVLILFCTLFGLVRITSIAQQAPGQSVEETSAAYYAALAKGENSVV